MCQEANPETQLAALVCAEEEYLHIHSGRSINNGTRNRSGSPEHGHTANSNTDYCKRPRTPDCCQTKELLQSSHHAYKGRKGPQPADEEQTPKLRLGHMIKEGLQQASNVLFSPPKLSDNDTLRCIIYNSLYS